MIDIIQLVSNSGFVVVAFNGTPLNPAANQVVLKKIDSATGKEEILQRQQVQPVGGSFIATGQQPGVPLLLACAFVTPDGKETEGSAVVTVTP